VLLRTGKNGECIRARGVKEARRTELGFQAEDFTSSNGVPEITTRRSVEEAAVRSVVQSLLYGVKKVYAVRRGYRTGIYFHWPKYEVQVRGFPGAVFKGFKSIKEAEDWLVVGRIR
jgi:hypothetical protein